MRRRYQDPDEKIPVDLYQRRIRGSNRKRRRILRSSGIVVAVTVERRASRYCARSMIESALLPIGFADARGGGLHPGGLADVMSQPAGACRQAGGVGDGQFELSERQPARQPGE